MSGATLITERSWGEGDQEFRASLGMWVFLATEILFFGGLFLAYAELRSQNVEAFDEAGKHANFFFGTLNTILLITSSFMMTIALVCSDKGDRSLLRAMLLVTLALGVGFLLCKGLEYRSDLQEHLGPGRNFPVRLPAAQAFFAMYWAMTGLHAVHLTVGLGVVGRVWLIARRPVWPENFHRTLHVSALYWHLIDVIWMMLYSIFYLVGRAT
ncbi:MAG TPA: cytochrome c oxidase subunit 3 [Rhizomicrobium sp.]|jgi:cytochrome c oxidase subunit 3|nr:cytochrome c oxidase subunit 3 [Rhizomicrobium sp.]